MGILKCAQLGMDVLYLLYVKIFISLNGYSICILAGVYVLYVCICLCVHLHLQADKKVHTENMDPL